MSDILVERTMIEERMGVIIERTDAIDQALGAIPPAPDGGVATATIAFIATAGAEALGLTADLY
jgi:hypothetical protein